MWFSKKINVTLLNKDWQPISELKFDVLPKIDELIYLKSNEKYYQVVNIIHHMHEKHGKIAIIKELGEQIIN